MSNTGFILIHKKLLDWEWYKDINTKSLFIHCLLKSNWESKNWQGIDIKRGSFVTSTESLAKELNLSIKQVRLSLDKLKRTNEIAVEGTNRYSLLTVLKYEDYQNIESVKGKQKGKPADTQRATTKEDNILYNNLTVNWDMLLVQFKELTGKKTKVIPDKARRQILARLKDGYSKDDLVTAIRNCYNDPFHKENNHKYLTLEFISRSDKFDAYTSLKAK